LLLVFSLNAVAEQRLAYSADSPEWLRAVGKLHVPGSRVEEGRRKHRLDDCSATLVASSAGSSRSDIVITAWHCLEFYHDLSRPILFTLLPGSDEPITREAYRLDDGGGMHADWALLKLYQPISAARVAGLVPLRSTKTRAPEVTMAGYSRDAGLGAGGKVLTYHPACRVTRWTDGAGESDCSAYKGASGGAVVRVSDSGQAEYTGVISRGNGEGISIFIPVADFRPSLNRALR
jgi:V8-like Glu-specific endopeptidase